MVARDTKYRKNILIKTLEKIFLVLKGPIEMKIRHLHYDKKSHELKLK